MACYKTYVLHEGDTLQMLAQIELGSVDRWRELVSINNLVYPYIVKTNAEKVKNPEGLVTYGDIIKLPLANSVTELKIDDFGAEDQQYIYDTALGLDLKMNINSDLGLDDEIAYLAEDKVTGDIIATSGLSNLRQSLVMRLLTRQGSLLRHPQYGTRLLDYIGDKVSSDSLDMAQDEIIRTCRTDERVKYAQITNFEILDGNKMVFSVSIEPINTEEAFTIFIDRAQNGTIKIR